MGKLVQVVAVLPRETFELFLQSKKVERLDTLPQLGERVKNAIRQFMEDNVGYSNEPIACLSRYNNEQGKLPDVGRHMQELFPVRSGSSFWQLQMPEDMVISIEYSDLLTYSMALERADDFELEFIEEEFKEKLILGYLEGNDVVSFLPFLDYSRCKFVSLIGDEWKIDKVDVPGVEVVTLHDLNIF